MIKKLKSLLFRARFVAGLMLIAGACSAQAAQYVIGWDAPASGAPAGYMLHYGTSSGAYTNNVDVSTATSYTMTSLVEGATYYLAVSSYDSSRAESAYSVPLSFTVPYKAPVATFSASGSAGTAPYAVTFTNGTTGVVTTWQWDFGDGATSTAQAPSHSYVAAGSYTVKLTATGPGGISTFTAMAPIVVKAGTTTSSTGTGGTTNSTGGTTTGGTTTGGTTTGGTTTGGTTTGGTTTGGTTGGTTTGGTGGTVSTTSTPTYKVTTSVSGTTTTTVAQLVGTTTAAPVARFDSPFTIGPAPFGTPFTSRSTGTITSARWDFGDGTTDTTIAASGHVYTRPGTYVVKLTVTGPGGTSTAVRTGAIQVTVPGVAGASGLVAAYALDETTGNTVYDSSGRGHSGTISNATWVATGHSRSALKFSGANSWVTIPDAPDLALTGGMTLSAWVMPTATLTGWSNVISKEQSASLLYMLDANSDTNLPSAGVRAGGVLRILKGGPRLTAGRWIHLTATFDGVMQKLYVNGTLATSRPQAGPVMTGAGVVRIGGNGVFGQNFEGIIDEVRIYNRALSGSEVVTDMYTAVRR